MIFYFARFVDNKYPEDSVIFEPGYTTEKEAKARIAKELDEAHSRHIGFPEMNDKKPWNYSVIGLEVDYFNCLN